MKHFTLKLFLLIACLCGATSMWAEDWSINFVGLVTADKTGVTISTTDVVTISNTTLGTCSYNNNISLDPKFVLQTGTNWLLRTGNSGLYQFNSSNRSFGLRDCKKNQIITIVATGDPNPQTNVTLKSSSNGIYVYTVNEDGHVKFTPARYLYFKSISIEDPAASTAAYSIKYVDESGNTLKENKTYEDGVGVVPAVYDADKEPIYIDDGTIKYSYYSDDAASKTIAADGSTVVTVVFHAIGKYNYSVKNNFGDIISSGSAFADETVNVYWSKYVNNEGKWFSTASPYGIVISEATDYVVNYTTEEDIAYFFESENLKKSRSAAATNTGTSYSGGYSPRHYAQSYWYTDLLQPGTYKISVPYQNNNSGTTEFEIRLGDDEGNYDEEVIANWTGTGKTSATLEATITIPEGDGKSVYIYNNTDWNSNCYMDYVIIQRTGNIAVTDISSVEYRTYITPFDVDFSKTEGLTAYVVNSAQRGESGIQYTAVTAVPANTPVILNGTEGTYNIYESAYTGEAITNVLKTGPVTVSDDNYGTIFVLNTGANGVGFYLLKNGKTMSEGKCYLEIPKNGTDDGAKFIGFHVGDATAIDSVRQMDNNDAAIYNMAGQRVMVPTKGLYIVNGKKVFIK